MNEEISFGSVVKERRNLLGLTQTELARRVGCAAVTIRKIEYDALRPSVQIAEHLAIALNIPKKERLAFVRLARAEREPTPIPAPPPVPEEIGQEDLSGRAVHGFQLAERIGTGGYGAVYRAIQSTIDREVAIKIILPKYADRPEFIRRFEAEAQLVARLEHPHIVPLYDYWREPGVAYLVMRFLRGGNLETVVQDGPLTTEDLLPLLEQICAALHAAHRAGVIHRDIKPANVLLDEDGNAYLADFGVAKDLTISKTADLTQDDVVIGSPAYISPEQILAEPIKPQTDIYSLGVMLYELLTGRKPFPGPTPVAYIQQHLHEPLPLLSQQNGDSASAQDAPGALDIVIGRATAKDPHERYPDILSMLADIRRATEPGCTVADLAGSQTLEETPPHVVAMLELPDLENPYKGLRAFGEADAADFFGRDTLIQALLSRMAEENDLSRFLAIVGPSGSGKSSVARAGLIPALRKGALPGSECWFIVEMLPGEHPFEELEAALLRIAVNPPDSLLAQLMENERGLLRAVRRVLPPNQETELVLVIDQFEELFTLCTDEKIRLHLMNSLLTAVLDPRSRLRVVITLRADFTDRPLQYVDFGELVRQRTEFVLPLTPDELEQAITGPTKRAGLALEAGLSSAIISDIGDQPGMLPLLQYALTELFEQRQGRLLTLTAYERSGGVSGALARRADELYAEQDDAGRKATRRLFQRLVTIGESTEDTRRRVLRAELTSLTVDDQPQAADSGDGQQAAVGVQRPASGSNGSLVLEQVIDQFGRHRLLTFDRDPATRGPTVEVAHEALICEWERLRQWLDEDREFLLWQQRLRAALHQWQASDQDEGALLRGAPLAEAENWFNQRQADLSEAERNFIQAGLDLREQRAAEREQQRQRELEAAQKIAETERRRAEEQTRSNKRLRWLAIGLVVFLLGATVAAFLAVQQTQRAEQQIRLTTARELAGAAINNLDVDPERSILLALQAVDTTYAHDGTVTREAEEALHQAVQTSRTLWTLVGHAGPVAEVDLSPDGTRLATASFDGTAKVWDTTTGQEQLTLAGHDSIVFDVVFNPAGTHLVTGSYDGTAKVWDAKTGQELLTLAGHSGEVNGVAYSPDGTRLATARLDGTANVWDAATGRELFTLTGHDDQVWDINFSPDGTRIATSSVDGTARIWDMGHVWPQPVTTARPECGTL